MNTGVFWKSSVAWWGKRGSVWIKITRAAITGGCINISMTDTECCDGLKNRIKNKTRKLATSVGLYFVKSAISLWVLKNSQSVPDDIYAQYFLIRWKTQRVNSLSNSTNFRRLICICVRVYTCVFVCARACGVCLLV